MITHVLKKKIKKKKESSFCHFRPMVIGSQMTITLSRILVTHITLNSNSNKYHTPEYIGGNVKRPLF